MMQQGRACALQQHSCGHLVPLGIPQHPPRPLRGVCSTQSRWQAATKQHPSKQGFCAAAAVTKGPTATYDSSVDHSNAEASRSTEQEEYVSRLQQATAEHAGSTLYNWLDHWYPVGFVKDFDTAVPHRFVLLGVPLVIWHDPTYGSRDSIARGRLGSSVDSEGWHVFADVCPHRLVPLSEGRVTPTGRLECPYHGWQFNATGACEVIPQEGNLHNPRACATAFPCVVRQGLLFVKPQPLPKHPITAINSSGNGVSSSSSSSSGSSNGVNVAAAADPYADVPTIPELDQDGWTSQDTWRDVPYDWASLMENVLDASHVPFTHHKSISNRNIHTTYNNIHLTQQVSPSGFSGNWPSGPRGGQLGAQETQFVPPCLMTHKIVSKSRGFESMVVVYAVPVGPGRCRLLNRNTFKFNKGGIGAAIARSVMQLAPDWAIHMGTQVPLEDDQIFLHIGELQYVAARQQGKSAAQAYYLPSKADTYITAFRRWIASFGGGGPFGDVTQPHYLEQIGARQSREQLLDRYSQHTASCVKCQAALKRVRSARQVLMWLAGGAASLALFTAAVAASSSVTAATVATAQAGGLLGQAMQLLTGLLLSVAGVSSATAAAPAAGAAAAAIPPAGPVGRLLVWSGVAALSWLVQQQLAYVEGKLLHGDYPPPRNTDRT